MTAVGRLNHEIRPAKRTLDRAEVAIKFWSLAFVSLPVLPPEHRAVTQWRRHLKQDFIVQPVGLPPLRLRLGVVFEC